MFGARFAVVILFAISAAACSSAPSTPATTGSPPAASPRPTSTPAQTEGLAQLSSYRSARNLICEAAWPARNATDERVGDGLYDPSISAAERATKIDAIEQQVDDVTAFVNQLDALPVPTAIATDEAASIARFRDMIELIKQVIAYLRAGDLVAAEAVDNAAEPLTVGIEEFERKYGLSPCP